MLYFSLHRALWEKHAYWWTVRWILYFNLPNPPQKKQLHVIWTLFHLWWNSIGICVLVFWLPLVLSLCRYFSSLLSLFPVIFSVNHTHLSILSNQSFPAVAHHPSSSACIYSVSSLHFLANSLFGFPQLSWFLCVLLVASCIFVFLLPHQHFCFNY